MSTNAPSGSVLPFAVAFFGLLYYGLVFFCIWQFYKMLSRINDNLAAISRAIRPIDIEDFGRVSPEAVKYNAAAPKVQDCPGCGLRIIPTTEGHCPSCHATIV